MPAQPANAAPTTPKEAFPFSVEEPKSTVRKASITIHGTGAPGAPVEAVGAGATTTVRTSGHWSLRVPLVLGENEVMISYEPSIGDDEDEFFYVTRRRTQAQLAAMRARRAQEKAAREARRVAKCNADPVSCMSDDEIVEACFDGRVTDFKTCYKAGFKSGYKSSEDAMDELEAEGYLP